MPMKMRIIILAALCAFCAHAADAIKASLSTRDPKCAPWNQATAKFVVQTDYTADLQARMIQLWRWFDVLSRFEAADYMRFTIQQVGRAPQPITVGSAAVLGGGTEDWTPDPRKPDQFRPPDGLFVCLTLADRLPPGDMDATLEFLDPPHPPAGISSKPDDLKQPLTAKLSGPAIPPKPLDPRKPENTTKTFDRELDFAGVLLSSVTDKTANGQVVRKRTTTATGDLFFAPILRARFLSYAPGNNLITFFTPFAIEAHASNQQITKDTLSQNRIVLGPEYEFRWYLKNRDGAPSDNLLRLILKGKDASDRDFKLNEPKFIAEIRPVWGKGNRDPLDDKYIKALKNYRKTLGDKIGRQFAPYFGLEKGKSYVRGIPASALTAVGPFTRGYLGLETGINFNNRLSLYTNQTLYVRGERDNDVVHYMKNTLEWTFLASRPLFASAVFLTFEKGQLPPFRSSVNSVNLGLRVQSSKWGLSNWR